MPRIEALCFDFDGVIADTETVWFSCIYRYCLAKNPRTDRDALLAYLGDGDVEMIRMACQYSGSAKEELLARVREDFHRHTEHMDARPGIRACLRYARQAGIPVAVVSNSTVDYVERWLQRLRLADMIASVVGNDGSMPLKPAPDLYLCALRRLGVRAENALAFEDSVIGLKAALAAGMRAVGYPTALSEAALRAFHPLCVDLAEVSPADLIRRLGAEGPQSIRGDVANDNTVTNKD